MLSGRVRKSGANDVAAAVSVVRDVPMRSDDGADAFLSEDREPVGETGGGDLKACGEDGGLTGGDLGIGMLKVPGL